MLITVFSMASALDNDASLVCSEPFPDDNLSLKCIECTFDYHLRTCSGVAETTYKSKETRCVRHGNARHVVLAKLGVTPVRGSNLKYMTLEASCLR